MIAFNFPGLETGMEVESISCHINSYNTLEEMSGYFKPKFFREKLMMLNDVNLERGKSYYITSVIINDLIYNYLIRKDYEKYRLYEGTILYRNEFCITNNTSNFLNNIVFNSKDKWILETKGDDAEKLLEITKTGEITYVNETLEKYIDVEDLNLFFDTYTASFHLEAKLKDGKYIIEKNS